MPLPKLLIIDDNQTIREILQTLVECEYDVEVIEATSGAQGVEILKEQEVDVIFSDYHMPGGNGDLVHTYNKENSKKPFFLITASEFSQLEGVQDIDEHDFSNYLEKPIDNEVFYQSLEKVFSDSVLEDHLEYKRIRIDLLLKYFKVNSDIYIRLSEKKYVKIINAGELEEIEQLEKYKERGECYAYLLAGDFEESTKVLMNMLNEKAKSVSTGKGALAVSALSLDVLGNGLSELGVTEGQVALVNSCVDSCVKNLKADKTLGSLLDGFFKEKGYLVSHSITAIHFSYMIAKKMDYSSEMILNKLTYAALLHDLSLGNSEMSAVFDKEGEKWDNFSPSEQKVIQAHPNEALKIIESIQDLPNDIENLIQEHHERPDGSGFPRGLSAPRIAPISCIFILALRMADVLFYQKLTPELKAELKADFEENWNKGNFRQPLKALLEILS